MTRRTARCTAVLLALAATAVGGAGLPAVAGPPATPPGGFAAAPTTAATAPFRLVGGTTTPWGVVQPGATYRVEGSGLPPTTPLVLGFTGIEGTDVGGTADARGRLRLDLTIPAHTPRTGPRLRLVACRVAAGGCAEVAAAEMTLAPATPPTKPTMPPTKPTVPPTRATVPPTKPTVPPTRATVPPTRATVPPTRATTAAGPGFAAATTTATVAPPTAGGGDIAVPTTVGVDPTYGTTPDLVSATTEATLPKAGDASLANLRITAVEVTQGLQDLQNRFPLVADRRTWVRVHARTDGDAPMPDVHAALEGVRNGQSLGLLQPQVDPVTLVHEPRRREHANTPYFVLPDSWTADGPLTLRAWIHQGGDTDASNEPTSDDNLGTAAVTFHTARPVTYHLFPLYLTEGFAPDGDPVIHTAADGYVDAVRHVRRLLPLSSLTTVVHDEVVGDAHSHWDLSDGEDADLGAPNAALQELHELGGYGDTDIFVGMVHTSLEPRFGGLSSGAQSIWVQMDNWFGDTNPWDHDAGGTLAHETGHAFDLQHAPCKRVSGSPHPGELVGGSIDPTFPGSYGWPNCSLAPTDAEGYYGFDPRPDWSGTDEPTILTNNNTSDAPNRAFPFMGYRGAGWLDPYHGCKVLQFLDVPCDPAALGVPAATGSGSGGGIPDPAPGTGNGGHGGVPAHPCLDDADPCANLAPTLPGDHLPSIDPDAAPHGDLVVVGHVNPASGRAEIVRTTRVPEHRDDAAEAGDGAFRLVVAGDGGTTATTVRLAPAGHGAADPDARRWFVARVPAPEALGSLELQDAAGAVLARRAPSTHVPTVALDSATADADGSLVVRWRAEDLDGAEPAAVVQVRGAAGGAWQTVGPRVTGGELRVAPSALPAVGVTEVRVLVGDGMLTSDAAVLPLASPVAGTLAPVDDATLPAGPVERRPMADTGHAGHTVGDAAAAAAAASDGSPVGTATGIAVVLGLVALAVAVGQRRRR